MMHQQIKKRYKAIAIAIGLILFARVTGFSQPLPIPSAYSNLTPINYVRTWEATAPEQNTSNLIVRPVTDVKQTTQYIDGFGRPMQTVNKQASPLGNDMVSVMHYDNFGLESSSYLPFTSNQISSGDNTIDGSIKSDPFQQQVAFYNNYLNGQASETNIGSANANWAYSKTNYEPSPLNRVANSFSPGANWVGSEGTTNHNIKQQFLVNTSIDNVQKWNINPWDINNPENNIIPTTSGSYPAGQLSKTIITDELNHQSIEFKDKYGRIVLKKVQLLSSTTDNGSGSGHSGWLCTYFVYDDFDNLRFVITPREVQLIDGSWIISQLQADELCYRYEYDTHNHLVVKKIPGTPSGISGETWMVYDQRNRVVMEQDPNLRAEKKWQYFQYDNLDRPASTGLITHPINYNNLNYHVSNAVTNSNSGGYSTWPVLSSYTKELMSQTFYDDYSWMNSANSSTLASTLDASSNGSGNSNFATSYNGSPLYAQQIAQSAMTRGFVMGSKSEVLDGTGYLYSVNFYDSKGRQIQVQSLNITGGKDIITTQFDWSGKILNSLTSNQYVSSTNPQTHNVFTFLTYDAMGRLLTVKKSVNSSINGTTVNSSPAGATLVSNQYDELGRLKSKVFAPYFTNFNPYGIEKMTYDYNVRGWQLGANRDYVKTPLSTTNYFGYDLGYDKTPITPTGGASIGSYLAPVFNGNIGGMVWKSRGDGVARKYDYVYDVADRLTGAPYVESNAINSWSNATIDFSVSNISYDANGNIGSMQQNGFLVGGSQPIDNFAYNYMNSGASNRLLNVIDNSTYNSSNPNSILGDLHYTGSKSATTTDYVYDANGNVITDNNRFTTTTYWDYNNMPKLVTITGSKNGSTIQYVYDAAGDKLKKITIDKSVSGKTITTSTTYIGEMVYKTVATTPVAAPTDYKDVLQYINDEEGRIRFIPGTPGKFVFDYFIKDHLGNVRMVLTDEQQQDISYPATLENTLYNGNTAISKENNYFTINTSDVIPNPSWLANAVGGTYQNQNNNGNPPNNNPYSNITANSQQIYQLCGNTANNISGDRYGLGITIKVMAGDKISIYGKSVWHLPTGQTTIPSGSYPVSGVLSAFLTSFANTSSVVTGGHGSVTGNLIYNNTSSNSIITSALNNSNSPSDPTKTPKAGINWILFDDQFRPVATGGSGFDPVNATSDVVKSHSLNNISMVENGYLYVFCSNESNINVYFDNLQVVNTRGPIAEETHYYPYGLTMAGISDRAWNKQTNYARYQGKEIQDEEFADGSGLDEYDFEARYYDPQIGRWHTPDPVDQYGSPYSAMENNPARYTDPDGKCPICIVMLIGAVVNVATHWDAITEGGSFNWGAFGSALAVGAGAGGLGFVTGGAAFEAMGVGGFLGGAVAGGVGSAYSSVAMGVGNGAAFGDVYTPRQFGYDVGFGTLSGGLMSGIGSTIGGRSFWDGSFPTSNMTSGNTLPLEKTDPVSETNSAPNADGEINPRNPLWDGPHGGFNGSGQTIQTMTIDQHYSGWTNLKTAKGIDGLSPAKDAAVQIKTTGYYGRTSGRLQTSKIVEYFNSTNYQMKILHIVTPPNFNITNINEIRETMSANHIIFRWTNL